MFLKGDTKPLCCPFYARFIQRQQNFRMRFQITPWYFPSCYYKFLLHLKFLEIWLPFTYPHTVKLRKLSVVQLVERTSVGVDSA